MTISQTFQVAVQHHQAGRLADAERLYRQILTVQPNHADALHLLGVIAHQAGRHDAAVELIRQSIAINPASPFAYANLGETFRALGRLDEAVSSYQRALEIKPDYPEANYNLGITLRERGQLDESIAAYRRALELKPSFPEAHNNLGTVLKDREALDEAISSYRRAIQLRPDYPEAHNNLGTALKDRGELEEAITAYQRALQIDPSVASTHSNLIFALHLHPSQNKKTIFEEHQRWNRRFSDPAGQFIMPHANARRGDRRLRIGYVSSDFRDHAVGHFVLPLLENHDRERFEIICYSGAAANDPMTERLRAQAGAWRGILGIPDARLAEMIREDRVDILVDLTMHTAGNRLTMFARQPAPVQVAWLGYPGSTGLSGIGYRLTDARLEPPEEESTWSGEERVRLPNCWCCYRPAGGSPDVNALPALSAKGVTFGSLNNFAKINDRVLARWARVLEAVKGSRLVMRCPEGQARERVMGFFNARGIGIERLELVGYMSRREYLELYHRIDLALDPFPYNGTTTTCEALWMGAPVLTLPGVMPASRAGLSLLSSIGLEELVTYSEDDYLEMAVALAKDLPRLADFRASMRERMQGSPLMDAPRFARSVETAYRSMWERWRSGESPIREDP